MRRIFRSLLLGLSLFVAAPAMAQNGPVVLELFTSQGCSSCPPADEMLGDLIDRDDVLPLSLHVDYWDYIGWADTFADPAFTARQQLYGQAVGSAVVYTPQMIVNGQDRVVGFRPMAVADLLAAHAARPDPVTVDVRPHTGGGVRVSARPAGGPLPPQIVVYLVGYSPHEETQIARGENAGRVAVSYNVVRLWSVIGEWDGQGAFEADVTPGDGLRHAVLFQAANHGAILGAARLD